MSFRILCFVFSISCAPQTLVALNDPETELDFSLSRYMGTWHQIAFIPNQFQAFCVSEPSAYYSFVDSEQNRIVNSCRDRDGVLRRAQGKGRLNKKYADPARLEVRFAPAWLSFLSAVWGDYWVLKIDADYTTVLVGSPDRQYLWVLARNKSIPKDIYRDLLLVAQTKGFDPTLMVAGKGSLD